MCDHPDTATTASLPGAAFFCKSCESMPELADNSVTLTMTSPPYWSLVDFSKYAQTGSRDDSWHNTYDQQYATYSDYLAAMTRVFAEVFRATKPGGILALQVASMQRNGRCYPIGCDLVPRLVDLGWEYAEHIIWNKCRDTSHRSSLAIQHPYPGYFYPALVAEHLYILRKPGPKLYRQSGSEKAKARARLPASPLFTRDVLKSIWHIAAVSPNSVDHPTVYPEELCQRVIALYSYPSDVVLDPFVGSGQTTKVAHAMGRRCVGYDIEPRFVELARSRVNEPVRLRRRQLVPRYDHVEDDEFLRVGIMHEQSVDEHGAHHAHTSTSHSAGMHGEREDHDAGAADREERPEPSPDDDEAPEAGSTAGHHDRP